MKLAPWREQHEKLLSVSWQRNKDKEQHNMPTKLHLHKFQLRGLTEAQNLFVMGVHCLNPSAEVSSLSSKANLLQITKGNTKVKRNSNTSLKLVIAQVQIYKKCSYN